MLMPGGPCPDPGLQDLDPASLPGPLLTGTTWLRAPAPACLCPEAPGGARPVRPFSVAFPTSCLDTLPVTTPTLLGP